mmetsp:Transcript_4949/g.22668  ORF Transcript_4949/g.22668 Transcript_4949/m.22668 type:complete len:302 (-) Transcript_4949:1133-2038(-)
MRLIAPSFDETFSTCSMNAPRGVLPEEAPAGDAVEVAHSSVSSASAIQDTSPEAAGDGADAAGEDISLASINATLTARNTSPSGYIASSAAPATEANEKSSTAKIARPSEVRDTRPIAANRSASSAASAAAAASNGTDRIAAPTLIRYVSVIATNLARKGGKIMKLPLTTATMGSTGGGTKRRVNADVKAPTMMERAHIATATGKVDTSPAHESVATTRRTSGRETSATSASAAVKPGRSSTMSAIGVTQSSGSGARSEAGLDVEGFKVLTPAGLGVRGSASASTSALGRAIHAETGDVAG